MILNIKKFNYSLLGFLLLLNIIAGGILPLFQENSKDIVKIIVLFLDILIIYMKGIKLNEGKILIGYFLCISIILLPSLIRTLDIIYAFEKIDGIVLCVSFSSLLLFVLYRELGSRELIENIIFCGTVLLILTIVYKLFFGFWDRNTRFFLNGANVFGWLMGFYTFISLYSNHYLKSSKRIFLCITFFLAVLWSQSKGALISTLLCSFLVLIVCYKSYKVRLFIISCFSIFIVFVQSIQSFLLTYFPESRLLAIFRIFNGDLGEADQGSVGARSELVHEAINFFLQSPILGIGLGNFKTFSIYGFDYPHNAHLEIFTENGIIVGIIYLIFIILAMYVSQPIFRIIILYFLLVTTFSGDLGYLRFAFLAILFSIYLNNNAKSEKFYIR